MDKASLVKKLNLVFCEKNKVDNRYSKVWLTDANFGGFYYSGDFILNIKPDHHLEDRAQEIKNIFQLLAEKAPEELKSIYRVIVFNSDDITHYDNASDLVFSMIEASC